MPDSGVIDAVSQTLKSVLDDAFTSLATTAEVSDLVDFATPQETVITIFLYEIVEDPSARNRPDIRTLRPGGPPQPVTYSRSKPPMALLLRYLLTPWGGDAAAQQLLVGKTLETLYSDMILDGPQLRGNLAGTATALKLTLNPLTLEERARVWYAIQKPYRLSLNYEVRVVDLDAVDPQSEPIVRERIIDPAMGTS